MDRPRRRLGEQRPAVHQGPVMPSPHQQLHPPGGVRSGCRHRLPGRRPPPPERPPPTSRPPAAPLAPASALLVLGRPARARRHRPGPTRPDARAHQPQQRLILGIHRDHPMDEEPRTLAVAAGAQPPPASRLAREAHLGGILHRHHRRPAHASPVRAPSASSTPARSHTATKGTGAPPSHQHGRLQGPSEPACPATRSDQTATPHETTSARPQHQTDTSDPPSGQTLESAQLIDGNHFRDPYPMGEETWAWGARAIAGA